MPAGRPRLQWQGAAMGGPGGPPARTHRDELEEEEFELRVRGRLEATHLAGAGGQGGGEGGGGEGENKVQGMDTSNIRNTSTLRKTNGGVNMKGLPLFFAVVLCGQRFGPSAIVLAPYARLWYTTSWQ